MIYKNVVTEEKNIGKHLREIEKEHNDLSDQIIIALSSAVDAKDKYTNGHSRRVALYSQEIARRLGWNQEQRRRVYYTGLLHDVGKIRISDSIINKKELMTPEEREEMRLHTIAGYYILKEISAISDFAIGARWHHERWDGKGYPNGLTGENIPIISRIVSIADAYDAMTSDRSYHKFFSLEKVRSEIENGSGTQFDPTLAKIVLQMIDEDVDYNLHQHSYSETLRILTIDDDPMISKILQFTLEGKMGHIVYVANSGKDGLEVLRNNKIDLVLLDVEMPVMNGFAVLEEIRKQHKNLPVIFMTGEKDMDIIQKAEDMGISDYLTKPVVATMLKESIQNVMIRPNTRKLF